MYKTKLIMIVQGMIISLSFVQSMCLQVKVTRDLTLFDKIWRDHEVDRFDNGNALIYIDRHLIHEVTSPQAFQGIQSNNRAVRDQRGSLATSDHNVPTYLRPARHFDVKSIGDTESRTQVQTLERNVKQHQIQYFGLNDIRQGIVHIIGPENGFTLPGSTVVCGDSHTATHGAFGALAFGIGTSEVEHVLATQTLQQSKAKNMRVTVTGNLGSGVSAKDVILHIIGRIGTAGGTGHVIEFAGEVVTNLSMEGRMTVCNMAIEAGARAGLIAPDDTTFQYLQGRPMCPQGAAFDNAVAYWRTLRSDPQAHFDREVHIDAGEIAPCVTWGTSPQDVLPITSTVPDPSAEKDPNRAAAMRRSLQYMGLQSGTSMQGLKVDKVFIGSCTNGRIEDLRAVAAIAKGRRVASHVHALVVPGSGLVKAQAEMEGLDEILKEAGFDWREPGCSMCLAMNPDKLNPGERCASTSNRNFEGRQGAGGRTHLMSPAMAAAAAVMGHLTDVRSLATAAIVQLTDTDWKDALTRITAQANAKQDELQVPSEEGPAVHNEPTCAVDAKHSVPADRSFTTHRGTAAVLNIQNIDTDMIIPKQFLKTVHRAGLGRALFHALRHRADGTENPDFVLNQPVYRGASILIAGANFGCGSSREHAPWALKDYGIRCIIAPSFADIFYNNCFKNGVLPVTLPEDQVAELMERATNNPNERILVDLHEQCVVQGDGKTYRFEIEAFRKDCLLRGLDEIGVTLQREHKIAEFERMREVKFPWL